MWLEKLFMYISSYCGNLMHYLVSIKQTLYRYLFEGDDLLKKTTEEMENLNLDMVWDVLDWYQTAIVLTRGNDVELEAEITCRIGYVYSKVL